MPQTVTDPMQSGTDDVADFLTHYRSAQSQPSDNDVASFLKQYRGATSQSDSDARAASPATVAQRANKDGTSSGRAVEAILSERYVTQPFPKGDPRSHDFGWSKDDNGN